MVPVERYCLRCGAVCASTEAACTACGTSLKITLPLDDEAGEIESQTLSSGPLPANTLLKGRYRIARKVGGGGFGAVYEAEDIRERRRVALKAISLTGLTPQQIIEATGSFNREVELLSSLRHPGIPRFYEQLTDSEHWYLAMEFVAGETLEDRLTRTADGRLPLEQALQLGIQLCDVLEYLHSRQPALIFRDLKPANIMLTPAQQLYVIDFGVARRYSPGKPKDTIAFGSPGYAAPEQYGRAQTTPRSDLYSLGATLHQVLTGQDPSLSPFRFQPLSAFKRGLPAELEKLIAQMLETDMERRPANVQEVRRRLQTIAATRAVSRRRTSTQVSAAWPRQPRLLASATTLANAFSTVGVTVYLYRGHASPVYSLAWAPDGTTVASCDEDCMVVLWDAFRRSRVHVLPVRAGQINDLAWAPDGQTLAVARDDRTVWLWRLNAHPRWWHMLALALDFRTNVYRDHTTPVNALSWSPDGSRIASAETKSAIHIWDAHTKELLLLYQGHSDGIEDVAWSPDGLRIASSSVDHSVQVWSASLAKRIWRWRARNALAHAISWSPDARYLACGMSNHQVHVWDILQERQAYIYQGHRAAVNSVAWSPDGRRVASASADGTVHLWRALDGKEAFIYRSHEDKVLTASWSPDGQHIASAGLDGIVHVWKAV